LTPQFRGHKVQCCSKWSKQIPLFPAVFCKTFAEDYSRKPPFSGGFSDGLFQLIARLVLDFRSKTLDSIFPALVPGLDPALVPGLDPALAA
jgi:hypothetical protein